MDGLRRKERSKEALAEEKGLSGDEFAFYGLFETFQKELFEGNDEKICRAAKDAVEIIQNKIVIDWIEREDIKKEMRRDIKDYLKKIGFPLEKMERFTAEILSLAEAKFRDYDGKN